MVDFEASWSELLENERHRMWLRLGVPTRSTSDEENPARPDYEEDGQKVERYEESQSI